MRTVDPAVPPDATEVFTPGAGGAVAPGVLTSADLARVERGDVCEVTLHGAMHGDLALGRWRWAGGAAPSQGATSRRSGRAADGPGEGPPGR